MECCGEGVFEGFWLIFIFFFRRASKKFQQVFTEVDEYDADVTAEVISSSLYAFYEVRMKNFWWRVFNKGSKSKNWRI